MVSGHPLMFEIPNDNSFIKGKDRTVCQNDIEDTFGILILTYSFILISL